MSGVGLKFGSDRSFAESEQKQVAVMLESTRTKTP